jgi:hypothetical protein
VETDAEIPMRRETFIDATIVKVGLQLR